VSPFSRSHDLLQVTYRKRLTAGFGQEFPAKAPGFDIPPCGRQQIDLLFPISRRMRRWVASTYPVSMDEVSFSDVYRPAAEGAAQSPSCSSRSDMMAPFRHKRDLVLPSTDCRPATQSDSSGLTRSLTQGGFKRASSSPPIASMSTSPWLAHAIEGLISALRASAERTCAPRVSSNSMPLMMSWNRRNAFLAPVDSLLGDQASGKRIPPKPDRLAEVLHHSDVLRRIDVPTTRRMAICSA